MKETDKPFFSIIIPTRDRPELFKNALESVCNQMFTDFEIIVINDGSSEQNEKEYNNILSQYDKHNIRIEHLIYRPNGHNSSFTRNYGVELSQGLYVCFLDDDDSWIDNEHLSNAHHSIKAQINKVDLYLSNQIAIKKDGIQVPNVWIEDLQETALKKSDPDSTGTYKVTIDILLQSNGFCHLNCSIYSRLFFDKINGLDENLRYEEDRDIYIRAIDKAGQILHSPKVIAQHNIPDKNKKNNISTQQNELEKLIFQLRIFDKGILFCKNKKIKKRCLENKMYVLKNITDILYKEKKYKDSYTYGKEAFSINLSLKWLFFCILIYIKSNLSTKP